MRVILLCLPITAAVLACASQGGLEATIPPAGGNDRAPVSLSAGPDELATRAAAERERKQWVRAERFVRWALALAPEHAGALVEGARLARDRGDHERARRYYAVAAALGGAVAEAVREERAASLVSLARAELDAGRVEQAAVLVEELEALGARGRSGRDVAELHGLLADVWLGRGLAAAGRSHAERAAALGEEGARTRRRLLFCEVLEAERPAGRGSGGASGLGSVEARVEAGLGRDAEGWVALARWLSGLGWYEGARWAAGRAIALGSGDEVLAGAHLAAFEAALGEQREDEASAACVQATRLMKPADGAAAAAGCAERFERAKMRVAALTLAKAAAERAPGAAGGVEGALLAAQWELEAKAPEAAVERLVAAAGAAPEAWRSLIAPVFGKAEPAHVARVLAAAREAGLRSWVAHATEVAHWRSVASAARDPEARRRAEEAALAALDAALRAGPGVVGLLELGRLARVDPASRERVVAVKGPGATALHAYLEAMAARGDTVKARAALEAALSGAGAFESASARARFELEAGEPGKALALAEEAVRLAGPEEAAGAESFAMGLALKSTPARIAGRALAWLALPADAPVMEAPYRAQWLQRLREKTRGEPGLQARVLDAILADETCRWSIDRGAVAQERLQLLAKRGDDAAYEAALVAWIAESGSGASARVEEVALKLLGEGRTALALRLFGRLHPEELAHREILTDLVRHLEAALEPRRARRVAARVIELPEGAGVGTSRLLALAQDLLDAGHLDLAARSFERAIEAGERTSRAYLGWIRARIRAGDVPGADEVITRFVDSRQRRDAKAFEELVKALMEEGRVGRAREVLEARLRAGEALDATTFNQLSEALWRSGPGERRDGATGLGELARLFVGTDPRSAPRQLGAAATRLVELRALEEARALVAQGLEARPRDPSLLSLATMIALVSDGPDAEALAGRTLRELGGTFDAWERVVGDVRTSLRPDLAAHLVTDGLERFPGAHRLLVLRGRVLLSSGRPEAAFEDFAEALARAPSVKDVLDPLEPVLERGLQLERLARLEGRALSLVPGRAELSVQLGRSLLLAGRVADAAQVFGRVAAETDRAHGPLAAAWFQGGYLEAALDAWTRAFDGASEEAAALALEQVASALAARGEASRLEPYVQLYLQGLRGADTPALLPIAAAWRTVGRPEVAKTWLARADEEAPSPESSLALMRLLLDEGDLEGGLVAAVRVVTRRIALAPSGRVGSAIVGPALEPVVLELIERGQPRLARELARRIAAAHGESTATRLLGARAMLEEGDAASSLGELTRELEPLRQHRELIGPLRGVLTALEARGHLDAALDLALRALEGGVERELALAASRLAVRSGQSPLAIAQLRRLAVTQPALNAWLGGDVLASERMARSSREPLGIALTSGIAGSALMRAALAATLTGASDLDGPAGLATRIPRLREDRIERALVEGFVESARPDPGAPARAVSALLPALRSGVIDPAMANLAAAMAALVGESALNEVIAALRVGTVDRVRQGVQLGRYLAGVGRSEAALAVFDGLVATEGGDGELALEVFTLALAAGDDARAMRWARAALGPEGEGASVLRLRLVDAAATLGAHEVARALLDAEPAASWKKSWALARAALDARAQEPFVAAVDEAVALAPDAAVMRVEAVAWLTAVVGCGPGGSERARWHEAARRLLAPLLASGDASARALELAFCTSPDAAAAGAALDRLAAHYPGPPLGAAALVQGALAFGDPTLAARATAAIPPAARRSMLVAELDALLAGQRTLAPALSGWIDGEVASAAPNEPTAVALEVLLARHRGDARGAARAAELGARRAPWSTPLALLHAHTLAATRQGAERAARITREVMARPMELGLFDSEARFLTPTSHPRAWEVLALARTVAGDREGARDLLARAMLVAPETEQPRLLLLQSEVEGDPGSKLRACVARGAAPWSSLCAERLRNP